MPPLFEPKTNFMRYFKGSVQTPFFYALRSRAFFHYTIILNRLNRAAYSKSWPPWSLKITWLMYIMQWSHKVQTCWLMVLRHVVLVLPIQNYPWGPVLSKISRSRKFGLKSVESAKSVSCSPDRWSHRAFSMPNSKSSSKITNWDQFWAKSAETENLPQNPWNWLNWTTISWMDEVKEPFRC